MIKYLEMTGTDPPGMDGPVLGDTIFQKANFEGWVLWGNRNRKS